MVAKTKTTTATTVKGHGNTYSFTDSAEKVIRWSQEDTYLIELTDDRGRRFHIELIFPDQEPDLASDWRSWRRYKSENRDRFERIDADLLTEHVRIAEEWE